VIDITEIRYEAVEVMGVAEAVEVVVVGVMEVNTVRS
jgi:hypothetical protein